MDTPLPVDARARSKCLERLERLHRGEVAALTTYGEALQKDGAASDALSSLRDDHRAAATRIGARIVALGGKPPTEEGSIWEAFAQAFESTAKLLGNRPALEALKLGENHGVDKYADAMGDPYVDAETRAMLDGSTARQKHHVAALDRLLRAR